MMLLLYCLVSFLLLPAVPAQTLYEYAAVCIPQADPSASNNQCQLTIIANATAYIQVKTVYESYWFTLPAGETFRQDLDENFHPLDSEDDKAIRITATVPLQVVMYKSSQMAPNQNDAYLVPERPDNSSEYFTTAYYDEDPSAICSGPWAQFYLLTTFEDDTSVHISQQDGVVYDLNLPSYGTFLRRTITYTSMLAQGTHITASKAVNVISGNLCIYNPSETSGSRGTYISSIPPVATLGTTYVIPNVITEDETATGFSITVVTTENDTAIVSEGRLWFNDEGETLIVEHANRASPVFLTCSKPCLVTQYSKHIPGDSGMFMYTVLPETKFATFVYFTTLDAYPTSYLSLVLMGEDPGENLYLNGDSLASLEWTPFNGYTTAILAIPEGVYELESMDDRPVAPYLYFHGMYQSSGAGFALLPAYGSPEPPQPTTPDYTTAEPTIPALYEYATVCIPQADPSASNNQCQLTIIANATAYIQVKTVYESYWFTLPAGETFRQDLDENFHPLDSEEDKAIRITATVPLQVVMYKSSQSDPNHNDAYLVPERPDNSSEYFTTAYYDEDTTVCGGPWKQFYLLTTFEDDTFIHITQQDGVVYDLNLPSYGTFLRRTTTYTSMLAQGTHITASKAISVISGNLCIYNPSETSGSRGTYISSIPPVATLGTTYVIPNVITEDETATGFSITVVTTENDTAIVSEGRLWFNDEGETLIVEHANRASPVFLQCSKPCLVTQYSKHIPGDSGMFMYTVLPETKFATFVYFTTLDAYPTSYLSLVLMGEDPGENLYLNGDSLASLEWTPFNGYTTAILAIPEGVYELESTDDRPFAAYLYFHGMYLSSGAGFALLPQEPKEPPQPTTPESTTPELTTLESTTPESTTPKPEPTTQEPELTTPEPEPTTPEPTDPDITTPEPSTPGPSVNASLPQLTASVNGTAYTEDGQPMTPQCAVAHLMNLETKTKNMMVEVNGAIGVSICLSTPGVRVVSSGAIMFHQGSTSLMEIEHILEPQGQDEVAAVDMCGDEVANYLNDHSHWPLPIFPPVNGCSRLQLNPSYFNTSGIYWNCEEQKKGGDAAPKPAASNDLSYESRVSELLSTEDGSSLDIPCSRAYTEAAESKTNAMMNQISMALAGSGCSGIVDSGTSTHYLTAIGNLVYMAASFYYVPGQSATFGEFVTCMQLVHTYTLQHNNWSPGSQPGDPFLPVPPGCPALEHDTPTLDHESLQWICT